jgi:hypothetical protein
MSLNQEVFLHNLEAARRKAGSVANLMGALDGTNMTYYGWKKKVPKNISSKLVTNLANYLGVSPEKLFTDKQNLRINRICHKICEKERRASRCRNSWKSKKNSSDSAKSTLGR